MITTLEIEEKIQAQLNNNDKKGALGLIVENALKAQQKTLERLKKIKQYDKYKLVFIGNFGSGKTTAINYLFDLVFETADVTKELLFTSAGRTTLCPVTLKAAKDDEKSYFEVEFISQDELEQTVEDFCILINNRVLGDKVEENSLMDSAEVPKEQERAIRNMAGLKPKSRENDDEAISLFKEKNNDFKAFKGEVLERINITVEEKQTIIYQSEKSLDEESDILEEKKWIQKTYKEVNLASIEGFSIPKSFTIYLSKNIYTQNRYFQDFEEIIDTRGISKTALRKDLENYVTEDNTICLFTSRFIEAPQDAITEFLANYTDYDKLFTERFFMLVLPRDNEPKNVIKDISYGDTVESWEEGVELQRITILDELSRDKVHFLKKENNDNIEKVLFFDAKRFFYQDKLVKEKSDNANKDKTSVFNPIYQVIEKRKGLTNELKELNKNVDKISEGIAPTVEISLIGTIKQLFNYQHLYKGANFNVQYRNQYSNLHHMTMHAIHRRDGYYSDYDAYYTAEYIIRNIVKEIASTNINSINQRIERLKNNDEILEVVVNKLSNQISDNYIQFYHKIASTFKFKIENSYFTTSFWDKLVDEFGQGFGYKYRVLNIIEDKLVKLNSAIRDETRKKWVDKIFNPTLEFLGVNFNKEEDRFAKIDIIEVSDYFGIEEIKINNLADKNEIYFLGENGHGKTIILQAIALALKGKDEGAVVDVLNDNEDIGKSAKSFVLAKNQGYLPYIYDEEIEFRKRFNSIFAYGINRLRPEPKTDKETKDVHVSLFTDDFNLFNPNRTIKSLKEHSQELYTDFIKLLNNLLDNEIEIIPYDDKIRYKENQLELSLYQLSHGYKSIIIWLSDLLYRLNKNQPEVVKVKDFNGIVLIDEIGAYLHPRLKYTLISKLRKNLPNIQWFFTTHSPVVTLGASSDAVFYKLYKDDNGATKINLPVEGIKNMTANSLITSLLWRVKGFTSTEIQPEYISDNDYVYQKIHEVVSKRIQDVPNLVDDDILQMIDNELKKLDEDESN